MAASNPPEVQVAAFCCPRCRGPLASAVGDLNCPGCGLSYPVRDGIPDFCPGDDFYEGRWPATNMSAGSLRNWLVKKERFFVQQLRSRRGKVLDLGCGGGWRLFTEVGPVTGVDLSHSSLQRARAVYESVARADLGELPFADDSYDFVLSSDVLGHVACERKERVWREIHRVLKSGGMTIHYIEADADDPLMRFAKRHPDLYERHIVAPEGHIGLETPEAITSRFRQAGFLPIVEWPTYRGIMYIDRVVQLFDNEYKRRSAPIWALVTVCKTLWKAGPVGLAVNVVVAGLVEVADRTCPESWAGGMLVCYQKR